MTNAATVPVPTVSTRGVSLASRALFAYLGALLGPLMAVHLFGRGAPPAALALGAGVGAIAGGLVARGVARPARSRILAALRVLFACLAVGSVAGMLSGVAWLTVIDVHPSVRDPIPVGLLFGGIFGLEAGAWFALPFAFWASRARAALDGPSAVRAHRMTIDAGVMLTAGGAAAVLLHRQEAFVALGVGSSLAGTLLVLAGVLRTVRLTRLVDAAEGGSLSVAARAETSTAPALVTLAPLNAVLVAPIDATGGASPFRANDPVREVAAVPADLAAVRRALGRAVAYGLLALAFTGLFDASLVVRALRCDGGCPSSAAPCGGCDH